jgi:signal transduction histidine kinase
VITNLLDNALRYTPSTGGIVVRLSKDLAGAHISICDAGPGLSPEEIAVVFEPYRRAASSLGRAGSGLGLYVSKQIVEAHGGRIGVESVRGMGARFFFALPYEE